jgi:hypothetical protein
MDAKLREVLATAVAQTPAQGALVADQHGLCVAHSGSVPASAAAGFVTSLVQRALALHGAASEEGSRATNVIVKVEADDVYVGDTRRVAVSCGLLLGQWTAVGPTLAGHWQKRARCSAVPSRSLSAAASPCATPLTSAPVTPLRTLPRAVR